MRLLPLSLLALLLLPRALSAQGTLYTDSLKRFTVQVPEGWSTRDLGDQGFALSGNGVLLRISPLATQVSPREAAANLVRQASSQWQDLQEIDRREIPIAGQAAAWILFDGADPSGKPGTIRLLGIQGGGVTVGVVIMGGRADYARQRGTIEATLATLRLGTNPPITFATYPTTRAGRDTTQSAPPDSLPPTAAKTVSMGLDVRDVNDDDVQRLGLTDYDGVAVDQVRPGGPADLAGIRPGDVILQLDRTEVDGTEAFDRLLGMHQPGDAVELLMTRNGRRRPVSVRLDAEP